MKYRYILSFIIIMLLVSKPVFWEKVFSFAGMEHNLILQTADYNLREGFFEQISVNSANEVLQNETASMSVINSIAPVEYKEPNIRVLLTFDGQIYSDEISLSFSQDGFVYEEKNGEISLLDSVEKDRLYSGEDLLHFFYGCDSEVSCLYFGTFEENTWKYEDSFSVTMVNDAGVSKQITCEGVCIIGRDEQGIYIVNELPLEHYLYYVVPSEMPSSFPLESLKAQAICARTYAVVHLQNESLARYNAHVNDTTAYQVYNATGTTNQARQAVDETRGLILCYEDEPITAFYYSCSCGHSTTPDIWPGYDAMDFPYLVYRNFDNLEEECPWYSWNYAVEEVSLENIRDGIENRYRANAECVTVYADYSEPESILPDSEEYNAILELDSVSYMEISARGTGDVAQELLVCGDEYDYIIHGEYSIRYVLGQQDYELRLQNGESATSTIVPSGFFEMECRYEGDELLSYELLGGGFGHGVGMSQYGAKYLANAGYSAQDILTYYYENVTIETIE